MGTDSSVHASSQQKSYRLFDSTLSLRTVSAFCTFLVFYTVGIVGYLHVNFSSLGTRLTTLEAIAMDETRVRKIMARDSEWSHDRDAIQRMIERHDSNIEAIYERMRNIEIIVAHRNGALDKLIKVVEMNAKTRKDAMEAARLRKKE